MAALELPASITETLAPLQRLIAVLNDELATADDRVARIAAEDPVVARLTTVPGIGAITATAYVAALDDAARFGRAAQVASYLGLAPREVQLGRTAATRAGDAQCPSLCPILARPGRVVRVAVKGSPNSRSSRLGPAHCAPTREEHCGGRLGPPPRAHPVRDVARRGAV